MRSASLFDPFRSSIARPTDALVYASMNASQRPPQDSGSGWSRFSFPVGILPPLQHAGLTRRTHGIDVRGSKYVNARKPRREKRVFSLSFITRECHPAFSRRVRATSAQERERRTGTALVQNAGEFDSVVHSDPAKLFIRYRPGIRPEAKN